MDARLGSGGTVTFDCGANPYTILLTSGKTISVNTTIDGGGIYVTARAQLTATNSQISHNKIGYIGQGGGAFAYNSALRLSSTVVNNNHANNAADGGGLYVEHGSIRMTGGTLNGNDGHYAGGELAVESGQADLTGMTIGGNQASYNGGGVYNFDDPDTALYLKNTILADSSSGGNCKGKAITSAQHNIDSDGTCNLIGLGNKTDVNPLLTYLANNGGWTKTHLPEIGSPALNGVSGSDCPSIDQRGVNRPQPGGTCDIGPVERAPSDPPYPIGAYLPIILH